MSPEHLPHDALLPDLAAAPLCNDARAHWLRRDTIVWPLDRPEQCEVTLWASPTAALVRHEDTLSGGEAIPLYFDRAGLDSNLVAQFPHLAHAAVFRLPHDALHRAEDLLRGQLAVTVRRPLAELAVTGVQLPGVLDDCYNPTGPLGITFDSSIPTLRVWAPTARTVRLLLFPDSTAPADHTIALQRGDDGVWQVQGDWWWNWRFYQYEVRVYSPATGRMETNCVTDPYSLSLSLNSRRSQIVNLDDPALKPDGWDTLRKPALDAPEDAVLYELHIRDFSATDPRVPPPVRGTYRAFTLEGTYGVRHLEALAEAGLTHIHLLPAFDISTVDDDRSQRRDPDPVLLGSFGPDSPEPAHLITAVRDQDSFNWGYDPFHFTVPEGSYSSAPDGPERIREFRAMVQALNRLGLRVVMDVVYNHTVASGQHAKSVLDRVVPGYYHRLCLGGSVEQSTCCENTASEHRMMDRLMRDSLHTWATAYKIDGFRFDLMGHHMKSTMVDIRAHLDGLTLERDGVDGRAMYLYGEGWDFGEVAHNARGVNASQYNMAGTGIGTFNDRIRDGVRGGAPFRGLREQGFATGLLSFSNDTETGTPAAQRDSLLAKQDMIKVGLAANLHNFPLIDRHGRQVVGAQVDYDGEPAGYHQQPREHVSYVEAHDNETFFDVLQLKLPTDVPMETRIRLHTIAMSIVMFSQGVPFFHAGQDMLRSKSLDRNSYNSGDWFNRIDWTGMTTTWGCGLPPGENERIWPLIGPLLANPALRPAPQHIRAARDWFLALLRLRKSTPLFRLRTADAIRRRVSFIGDGPGQVPGLIVMQIDGRGSDTPDPKLARVLVAFNATPQVQMIQHHSLVTRRLELHPLLRAFPDPLLHTTQHDTVRGRLRIPPLTTAVLIERT